MLDLDSVIGAMDGSVKNDIVMDLSPYFESYTYHSRKAQDTEGFEKKFREVFGFIDKEKIDSAKEKAFMFNANFIDEIVLDLVKRYVDDFRNVSSIKITNDKFTDKALLQINIVYKKLLSELGDYDETVYPSGATTSNEDTIILRKDNTVIIKFDKSLNIEPFESFNGYTPTFIVSFDTVFDFEHLKTWPLGFRYVTPLDLYDGGTLKETVIVDGVGEINVHGDFRIKAELPIDVSNCSTLIIKGNGTLVLEAGDLQPCIGSRTHSGMSYGRWSPGPVCKCKKIYVVGCTVVCKSKVKNFTLGRYGTNEMPEIELQDGGHIICPEWQDTRYIEYQASPPCGSTKISEAMKYGLR